MPARDDDAARFTRTRDHLANERTYLAWLRTAGAVMLLGLAIAQLAQLGQTGYPIAARAILISVGAAGLINGTVRYRRVNSEIEQGSYVTGTRGRGPTVASAVLLAAVAAMILLVV